MELLPISEPPRQRERWWLTTSLIGEASDDDALDRPSTAGQ